MNVVIFVSDALRADHLSCYGYDRPTTPFIDEFARTNVRYENAYAPVSWTRAAAASILTGTYPSVHGVQTMDDSCETDLPRAPEIFGNAGFETSAVSAIGNVSTELGYDVGFDTFVDLYKADTLSSDRPTSTADAELLDKAEGEILFPEGEHVVTRFEDTVLDDAGSGPFFSLLWTIDTHDPFHPPSGYDHFLDPDYDGHIDGSRESLREATTVADFERLRNLYDSELRYVDDVFGSLIETLRAHGIEDDTLVVFTADHGEALGDHGGNVGHGHVPYEELLSVPLVVKYPNYRPSWTGDGEFVSLVDLLPTLLDYCGLENPTPVDDPYAGRSVLDAGRDVVFSETAHSTVQNRYYSVRKEHHKYIRVESPDAKLRSYLRTATDVGFMKQFLANPLYFFGRRFGGRSEHLYDLAADPSESDNLADESPKADEIRSALRAWREGAPAVDRADSTTDNPDLSDETEHQLREMGYL